MSSQTTGSWPEAKDAMAFVKPRRLVRDPRKDAVRKQVIVTVLMRQGLTRAEAEEQFELGVR